MNRRQFNMITGASAVSTLFDRPRAGLHEIRNTTSWAVSTNTPDGKYIAFSYGPNGQQHVGRVARAWHTCVADAAETNVWVPLTTAGDSKP